eukprot:3215401-Alexandrium_andersonii.AAC.1
MSSFRAPRTPEEFCLRVPSCARRVQSGPVRYSAVIPPLRLLRKKFRLTLPLTQESECLDRRIRLLLQIAA